MTNLFNFKKSNFVKRKRTEDTLHKSVLIAVTTNIERHLHYLSMFAELNGSRQQKLLYPILERISCIIVYA